MTRSIDRYSPMEDRIIYVRQFASRQEATQLIRAGFSIGDHASRVYRLKDVALDAIEMEEPVPEPGRPTYATAGIPSGTVLTVVTPEDVYALGPGVEAEDLHIVGAYKPTTSRVHRRCLFSGTNTPGTVSMGGVLTDATAPHIAVESDVPQEFYRCQFRCARYLVSLRGGGIISASHFSDAGEAGFFAGNVTGPLLMEDSIIEDMGHIRYHDRRSMRLPLGEARGFLTHGNASLITIDNCVFNMIQRGSPGGPPSSEAFAPVFGAIRVDSREAPSLGVKINGNLFKVSAYYAVHLYSLNFGDIQPFTITNNDFAPLWVHGPVTHVSGSGTVSGNKRTDTLASLDAQIVLGV